MQEQLAVIELCVDQLQHDLHIFVYGAELKNPRCTKKVSRYVREQYRKK